MKMRDNKDLLGCILSAAQLSQTGIRTALDTPMSQNLRKVLETQLKEYDSIEYEALEIAASRGWELRDIEPATKLMTRISTRAQLLGGNTESRLAAMRINGCTKGMILGLQQLHRAVLPDPRVENLSLKLLDSENANIRQMQGFL